MVATTKELVDDKPARGRRQEQRQRQGQERQERQRPEQRQRQEQGQERQRQRSPKREDKLDLRQRRLRQRRDDWRQMVRQQLSGKRQRSGVSRQFLALTRGFTAADWMLMHQFQSLRNKIYSYNHEKHECIKGDKGIQWPIVWTLARYHQKH